MNRYNLQIANRINDEIKKHEQILEWIERNNPESEKTKPSESPSKLVVDLFVNCRNLGSESLKNELALCVFIEGKKHLESKIKILEEKIEAL